VVKIGVHLVHLICYWFWCWCWCSQINRTIKLWDPTLELKTGANTNLYAMWTKNKWLTSSSNWVTCSTSCWWFRLCIITSRVWAYSDPSNVHCRSRLCWTSRTCVKPNRLSGSATCPKLPCICWRSAWTCLNSNNGRISPSTSTSGTAGSWLNRQASSSP